MENRRFDHLTKSMATGGTRRTALRLLGGSALATGLARLGLSPAAGQFDTADDRDANCRGSCDSCKRDGQCCSRRCEGGVCQCKERGRCSHDRACCSGRCRSDGRCKRAPDPGCAGGGPNTCANANPTSLCDHRATRCGPERSCTCLPTISGSIICAGSVACSEQETTCQTDEDCVRGGSGAGARCLPSGATAFCRFQCGGNGNACAQPCRDSTRVAATAEREGWVTFRAGDR